MDALLAQLRVHGVGLGYWCAEFQLLGSGYVAAKQAETLGPCMHRDERLLHHYERSAAQLLVTALGRGVGAQLLVCLQIVEGLWDI
jgi:hypothetical protein